MKGVNYMKKKLCFILSFVLCITSFIFLGQDVLAQENNVFIENINNEITPDFEMVELGNEMNMDVYAFQTKKEIPTIRSYSLTNTNNKCYELTTNYYFVSKDATNGYMYKQDSTAIVSAAAHLNINIAYDYYIQNNSEYGKLISTSGSVTGFNSGFRFVRADVNYGSSGPQYPSQAIYATSYSSSWSYSAPTNWGYNILGSGWTAIGSNATAYITRDGSVTYSGSLGVNIS